MPSAVTSFFVGSVAAAGYLVGSVPIANRVARRHLDADLRDVGDRNPGYWNAREQFGSHHALPILVGDVAKGAAAAGIGRVVARRWMSAAWWMPYVGGGASMVGHAWPAFAGFRGGRSVLTFVGTGLVAAPAPAVAALTITGLVGTRSRRFDYAARAGIAAFPIVQLVIEGPRRTAATGVLMTFIGFRFAHATG